MHYTGTVWRPPYEASSLLIEATAGCTHHKCKFCTLYDDLPFKFRLSPLEDIEEDLKEAQRHCKLWGKENIKNLFSWCKSACAQIQPPIGNSFSHTEVFSHQSVDWLLRKDNGYYHKKR